MSNKCLYTLDAYKRERSEKLATVLAIVLALGPWGLSVPVTYRWGLWGLCLMSVLYLIFTIIPPLNYLSVPQKVAMSIAILTITFTVFWPVMERQYSTEKASAVEGDIEMLGEGTKVRILEIGESGTVWRFDGDTGPALTIIPSNVPNSDEAVRLLYDSGLKLELKDGKLLVSTPIRDRQGRLIALVHKNHWSVTSACLDKNYSKDSFEVLDARGLVVFQMRLLTDRVQLQGEWRDEFGNGVRLKSKKAKGEGAFIDFWRTPQKEQELMALISPMFRYPSVNHWSEFRTLADE